MLISLNYNLRENHHNAIFMPAVFENNDLITNTTNTTTSHLNDNLVSLYYFFCVTARSWDSNVGQMKLGI